MNKSEAIEIDVSPDGGFYIDVDGAKFILYLVIGRKSGFCYAAFPDRHSASLECGRMDSLLCFDQVVVT